MIMDIIVVSIILISIVFGVKKGFAITLLSFMQWILSLLLAFIFCSIVKTFLIDKTPIDNIINAKIISKLGNSLIESSAFQSIPALFSKEASSASNTLVFGTAENVTSILMTIISFLLIIIAIKLLCQLIYRLFSKKYHKGLVGFIDGALGFILGAVRGAILVLLFFALLCPLAELIIPSLSAPIANSFNNSYFAGILYDDNFLLVLVRDLFI